MVQDERIYRDLDLDEVLELYREGGMNNPLELRRQRAYRVDLADEILKTAVKKEGRALTPEEIKRIDNLTAEARELALILEQDEAKRRRELEESLCYAPLNRPY